jgi:hypothetical protein
MAIVTVQETGLEEVIKYEGTALVSGIHAAIKDQAFGRLEMQLKQ